MKNLIFCFFISMICISCKSEIPVNEEVAAVVTLPKKTQTLSLLLFKKEEILEVWSSLSDQKEQEHLFTFSLSNVKDLPLGIFDLVHSEDTSLHIQLPGAYYAQKLKHGERPPFNWQLELESKTLALSKYIKAEATQYLKDQQGQSLGTVVIFPNDLRKSDRFDPCFACPHWMAEVYGQLELKIKRF